MMIRLSLPVHAGSGALPGLRALAERPCDASAQAMLHAAAFALLCLWTQTRPQTLRRQFVADADPGFGLGRESRYRNARGLAAVRRAWRSRASPSVGSPCRR